MDNKKGIIIVIVLFVVAALIFGRHLWVSQQETATRPGMTAADVEKRVREIENDPHMPPQAKAIAIGQLRAHTGGQGAPVAPGGGPAPK